MLETPNASVSAYAPTLDINTLTLQVKRDFEVGVKILSTDYNEFGGEGLSPLFVAERDKKAFNSYEAPASEDPDENWRWRGIRPITRNKIISIAGHFIAAMLFPNIFAQNEQDEEDKDAANLMRDLIIWNIENSNYKISYLFGIVAALVNPVAYLEVEFAEIIREIKEKSESGKITMREAIDEMLSGFRLHNVPMDEIVFDNAYEYDLQNQRWMGRRRFISFDDAKSRFGKHKNWKHVRPGIRTVFDEKTQGFYDIYDELNPNLVEWFVYYNRTEDQQIDFINGIYFGEDNIEANLIKHRRVSKGIDGKPILVPVYPFVKFGYSPIDEKRFFFYKSAVNELGPQQRLVDRMWQMVMDGTFLEVLPPLAIVSNQVVKSNVFYPGATTTFQDRETTINPLRTGTNLTAGFNAMTLAEQDLNATGKTPNLPAKSGTTAFEVSREIEQSRIQLGIFGGMVSEMVKQLGMLMIDVILQHQTVGDIEEITAGNVKLRYKKFLLPNQNEGGKKVTKVIELTDQEMTGEMDESMDLMQKEGGFDADKRIYKVNPNLFRRMKFLVRVDPDQLLPKNEIFDKALKLEAYDRLITNPFIDQEAVSRDFLIEPFAKGEAAKYMRKEVGVPPQMGQQPATQGMKPGNMVSQMTGNSRLAELIRS